MSIANVPQFSKEYVNWLSDLKLRIRAAQLKAAISVNSELLKLYWQLGALITKQQEEAKWGDGLINRMAKDLSVEFPEIKGFSRSNLKYVKQWYLFYREPGKKVQQPVGQLGQQPVGLIVQQPVAQLPPPPFPEILRIPWGHNIAIISRCKNTGEALFYVRGTIANNWSRSVLVHQLESGLHRRSGKAVSNFSATLPKPQSDLAGQVLKDPYIFDFLTMSGEYRERELESALIERVTQFLLELGAGFAYMGRQVPLKVGGREFFIDLLFYHVRLRCYVVVELKTADFEPEHAGKLNFYLKAVDETLRREHDRATIGLLICKSKDRVVAEYSLSDIGKPIGVSSYRLTQALPKRLRASLPQVSDIEQEFKGGKK